MDIGDLRKQAVSLRKGGLSYGEIQDRIGVSKSTLSYWLKNIPLKPEHKKRFYTSQIHFLTRTSFYSWLGG